MCQWDIPVRRSSQNAKVEVNQSSILPKTVILSSHAMLSTRQQVELSHSQHNVAARIKL